MIKHSLFAVLLSVVLACTSAKAQNLCPPGAASDKLICVIPQAFGVNQSLPLTSTNSSQFQVETLNRSLRPLDSAVARDAALLPLASPASGLTFTWNSHAMIFVPSTDSFGPILSERAQTIGKYRLFVGYDYQHFAFDQLDGIDLKKLPVVLTQQDDTASVPGRRCSLTGDNATQCAFIRDVVTTNTAINASIHQFTTFVSFGLTDRIDVSVAIPIENIRLRVSTIATIVDNSHQGIHSFPINPGSCGAINVVSSMVVVTPCLVHSVSNARSASGIGDITLRIKGAAWKGERAAVALGADIRFPTGDALNFLGAGAAGFKPFIVWSYRGRIAPHAFLGYEVNGSSLIAGDISVGTKERLPGQLSYSAGVDVRLTKWLTAAGDAVGQEVFEGHRTSTAVFTAPGACVDTSGACKPALGLAAPQASPNLAQSTGSFNATGASVGLKMKPLSNFLMTGNVLLKLNNGGLRAKTVPLLGVSYTF